MRSCHHPVLVASRQYRQIQRFVLAFDGGASAQKAVAYAAEQPLLRGLEACLLYVGSGNAKIEAALGQAKSQLEAVGTMVSVEQRDGEPEKIIAQVVASDPVSLLVMGAYGHSAIRQMIVGSTTTAMIREALTPVLLFR